MKKSDKNLLTWFIRELLHLEKDITIISDDGVIHLEVKGIDFYLYIKSLTYAGNPYPKNTTRAQLPRREEFEEIKASDSIFLFLGYDETNEVFACWDPKRTKERLNEKQYVSFFSRLNLQESASQGHIIESSLQNDFKYILFKINDLPHFLIHIKDYFPSIEIQNETYSISNASSGILIKIEDDSSVRLFIDEQIEHDSEISDLTLISNCMNEFGEFYDKLTLKDWFKLVRKYREKKIKSSLEYESEIFDDSIYLVSEPDITPSDDNNDDVSKR